jgi:hypothetical protein
MPIFVWIVGKHRAVPHNYVELQPDFKAYVINNRIRIICVVDRFFFCYSRIPWQKCAFGANDDVASFNPFGSNDQCTPEYQQLLRNIAKE